MVNLFCLYFLYDRIEIYFTGLKWAVGNFGPNIDFARTVCRADALALPWSNKFIYLETNGKYCIKSNRWWANVVLGNSTDNRLNVDEIYVATFSWLEQNEQKYYSAAMLAYVADINTANIPSTISWPNTLSSDPVWCFTVVCFENGLYKATALALKMYQWAILSVIVIFVIASSCTLFVNHD